MCSIRRCAIHIVGLVVSLRLGFHDDLADPKNPDPVLRQSTRLTCMAVYNGQTSYDPRFIRELEPGTETYKSVALAQLFEIDPNKLDNLPQEKCRLFEEVSALPHLTKDDAPVLLVYRDTMDTPITSHDIGIHHPRFGKALKEKMDALGIECQLATGVKRDTDEHTKLMMDFVKRHFGLAKARQGDQREQQTTRTALSADKVPDAVSSPSVKVHDLTVSPLPGDKQSKTFKLRINGHAVPVVAVPAGLEPGDYARTVEAYAKLPAWCHITQERLVGAHYAHLEMAGDAEVEVSVAESVKQCSIRPLRRGVQAKVNDNTVSFKVDQKEPRYLIVDIDQLPILCLLIDPPDANAPSRSAADVVDGSRFLTDATGQEEQTAGFAAAIAAVSGTGKTLYVPAGVYLTDTIKIHKAAGFKMYLAPGCLLRLKASPHGQYRHAPGIWIDQAEHVTIFGRGCLDMQAYENYVLAENNYRHTLPGQPATFCSVFITRSRGVTVEGLTLRNGRAWNFSVNGNDDVTLRRCKVITPPACMPEWTDGIDIVSSVGVLVENCFVYCNDDVFTWGNATEQKKPWDQLGNSRETRQCVVRGLVGAHQRANGLRLGGGADLRENQVGSLIGLKDITFENCDLIRFFNADCRSVAAAVRVAPLRHDPSAKEQPRYGVVRLVDCGFECDRPETYRANVLFPKGVRMDHMELVNVRFDSLRRSAITGRPDDKLGEVILKNIIVGDQKVTEMQTGGFRIENARHVAIQ